MFSHSYVVSNIPISIQIIFRHFYLISRLDFFVIVDLGVMTIKG